MKVTTVLCSIILAVFALFCGIYALFEFNLLLFLCNGNTVIYRSLLGLNLLAGGWLVFWLLYFRPQNALN